ncbi:hypothetical protein M1583_00565 [Candidatus Marsarchaeota archaeon]|nr:hypothetical protein [Candidatus Marsarchaeota archaeon]
MKGFRLALVFLVVALIIIANVSSAQYWFQSGARASQNYSNNDGASVSIETVYPQNLQYGSFGFWVGEILSNGAFIQVGYEIPNQSGYYPTGCMQGSPCAGKVYIKKDYPSWFWEYFPAGDNSSVFYGSLGPNDSVGANGTFNTYSFKYSNGLWDIYVNGKQVGSVNLGTDSSGNNVPTVFAEYADASNNNVYMEPVVFSNLSVYKNGMQESVSHGYSYIGYGTGSEHSLPNDYGVKELSPYVNRFEVGSGLPIIPNFTTLWTYGYYLHVSSIYGNSFNNEYSPYSTVRINEPQYIYISNGIRERFMGWSGSGIGSYSGTNNSTNITLSSNITEEAIWQTQYYINATTPYGNVTGSGWYQNDTQANIAISSTNVSINNGTRMHFVGFSNGVNATREHIIVISPINISAIWQTQYYINATTPYGNVTGSGWYNRGSNAKITLSRTSQSITKNESMVFVSWSNGATAPNLTIAVNGSYSLIAQYGMAYLERIVPVSQSGDVLNVSTFTYRNRTYTSKSIFMLSGNDTLSNFNYGGVNLTPSNPTISITEPGIIYVKLPVYNVTIMSKNIFGSPISSTISVKLQNGSIINGKLGPNGAITIPNVPYGNLSGTLSYSGFTEKISSMYSDEITVEMLTPGVILGLVILMVIIASFWFYMQFRDKKSR